MATYDLTSSIPTKVVTGDILNCPYSGSSKSITLPKGVFTLEVWGAQGGDNKDGALGGRGGYSIGTLTLAEDTAVYLYAGQKGLSTTAKGTITGNAFNGGGKGSSNVTNYANGSGGGASDIRIGQDSLYARVIVAGAGGGAASSGSKSNAGGIGGGTSGGAGANEGGTNTARAGQGGTQSAGGATGTTSSANGSPGSFGAGGDMVTDGTTYVTGGGGGGGWYGGGSSSANYAAGGGGSGYVYTSSSASNYPSGCLLTSDLYLTDPSMKAGDESMTSPTGTSETGHTGNGYVRITVVQTSNSLPFRIKVSGIIKEVTTGYVKVNGTWKKIIAAYTKINGTWKD